MTTHIFLALGMWNEVVSQNMIASGPDRSKWVPGHYTQWLQYGLLQLGRAQEADSLLRSTVVNAGAPLQGGRASYALAMRAAQIINGQQWLEQYLYAPLDDRPHVVGSEAADAFAQGYAALQRGEPAVAATERARFPALRAQGRFAPGRYQPATVEALAKALDAAIAFQAGHQDEALLRIAEANQIEDAMAVEFGPPTIVKPTWELRGGISPGHGPP